MIKSVYGGNVYARRGQPLYIYNENHSISLTFIIYYVIMYVR